MEKNDRTYSPETIFIRMRLGQQFTMDGPVLDDNGRIKHKRFDFDASDRESFVHNKNLLSLFKDQHAGYEVELNTRKGQSCLVVCGRNNGWTHANHKNNHVRNVKYTYEVKWLKEGAANTSFNIFDVTGKKTVEIIKFSIEKCRDLSKLFPKLDDDDDADD
jgi:hypothetical protein